MGVDEKVSLTWLGHATWQVKSAAGKEILVDPWLDGNPALPEGRGSVERCDLMLVTHGHFDHVSDVVSVAQEHHPTIICSMEMGTWIQSKGIAGETLLAMNKGGTVDFHGIQVTMVHADHTAGLQDGGSMIYVGEPCGYVVVFENGFTVYFTGDTDVFGDMRLIAEMSKPDLVVLPIGGFYTMGPERAAKAVELIGAKKVAPTHFGTFPVLSGRPADLQALVGPGVEVFDVKPGDTI